MRLLRFGTVGSEKVGMVDKEGITRDASSIVEELGGGRPFDDVFSKLAAVNPLDLPEVPTGTRIGACVAMPANFIAIGLNYADHAEESGMPIPTEPILFSKSPNCIVGPNDNVVIPKGATQVDWEIELAFVVSRRMHQISEAEAMDHIAGYCICNDVSERGWQLNGTGQWLKGKSAPTFGPLGPCLVTPDEIKDPSNLTMHLTVNGETMQKGSTRTMIFDVPRLLSFTSRFMELLPGDVITTGTPPGVGMGMEPPRYLTPGDRMELAIDGLGRQRQQVV